MSKITDTLIIRVDPNVTEGVGFNVDLFTSEENMEDGETIDGGHYTGEDISGALAMAVGMAEDLINRKE